MQFPSKDPHEGGGPRPPRGVNAALASRSLNAEGPRLRGPSKQRRVRANLLDLHRAAGLFELGLERLGLLLGDTLLDGGRRPVREILRLLEAEVRDRADDLDHLDLLVAGVREDDIELGLLLARGSAVAAPSRSRAGRGDGHW